MTHAEGTDTLNSVEGFWFKGEGEWYSLEDAFAQSQEPEEIVDDSDTI